MKITRETRGSVAVLRIEGEYDSLDVETFEGALASLAGAGTSRVVLDLSGLTFINSTALGTIIRGQERMAQAGGDLVCAALSKFTERTFRLLGMDQRVRSFATEREAVAALEAGAAGPGASAPRVGFRFPGEGAAPERRAEVVEVHGDGLSFRFDNVEGLDVLATFVAGREIELRLGAAGAGSPGEVRARGRVEGTDVSPGGKVVVRASLAGAGGPEQEALARLARDLPGARGRAGAG
jgi:anti-sigma B factor antagonist